MIKMSEETQKAFDSNFNERRKKGRRKYNLMDGLPWDKRKNIHNRRTDRRKNEHANRV